MTRTSNSPEGGYHAVPAPASLHNAFVSGGSLPLSVPSAGVPVPQGMPGLPSRMPSVHCTKLMETPAYVPVAAAAPVAFRPPEHKPETMRSGGTEQNTLGLHLPGSETSLPALTRDPHDTSTHASSSHTFCSVTLHAPFSSCSTPTGSSPPPPRSTHA